ncbi:MAG TPA: hypothetical protein VMT81_01450 [Candidatus Paceibacterota bacterium]|nr:hypothetical protein [Candidatus Paceibacterota bacterium]
MKKITVEKGEGIAEVIDKILAVPDADVLLAVPNDSELARSASNFRLLKREADSADKIVVVESVDEAVLSFAKENGIEGSHPFLKGAGGVSDIIPQGAARPRKAAGGESVSVKAKKEAAPVRLAIHAEEPEEKEEEEEIDKESFFGRNRFFKPREIPDRRDNRDDDDDDAGEGRGGSGKVWAWTIGVAIVLVATFYVLTVFFGRAKVEIDFTQTPWSYQGNFTADKSVTAPDPTSDTIPAQVFTTDKNVTQQFPATGASQNVSIKAQGTITIYNDYGSAPQELVATTRFLTPDGKLFRLVDDVTVPGATVAANGTITPSSITAAIVADQGGPAYNVGPVPKLTIPGFQNNPGKYAGFYGAITGQTTGGATGNKPIPTAADISNAKASTTAILQADLENTLTTSYPNNFKILDGATDIQITKLTVNTSTDASGDFSVFGEASLTAIGFDQNAFTAYLLAMAQTTEPSSTFKTLDLSYSDITASFSKGTVSFALSAQGSLEPAVSSSDLAISLAGKSINDARTAISALPELSNGTISVWPVWLWSMPSDPQKIAVTVN